MAEFDDLWVEYVLQWTAILVFEPLGKSLDGEPRCSESGRYRLSRKTLVEEQNAFLTPLFDVPQCVSAPSPRPQDQDCSRQQFA